MSERSSVELELLHAYHDGEVEPRERERVEAALANDAQLRAELESLQFIGKALERRLDTEAERVPEARFEQIWEGIDHGLDRGDRLQEAAEREASIWSRLSAWVPKIRLPVALAGAAAAVAVVMLLPGDDEANKDHPIASVPAEDDDSSGQLDNPHGDAKMVPPSKLAQAPSDDDDAGEAFPEPESNEADIERIDFGGRTGRIERIDSGKSKGTTTVIWFTEEDSADSERSL